MGYFMGITVELSNYDYKKKCLFCDYNNEGFCDKYISWCNFAVLHCDEFVTVFYVKPKSRLNKVKKYSCMKVKSLKNLINVTLRKRKGWLKEETNYLLNAWGKVSIPTIARNLGRTIFAITNRATKLGLGRHLHSGDYITLNQLVNSISVNIGNTHKTRQLLENGIPYKTKKSQKKAFRIIYIKDFWQWAENHKDIIDFAKLEENSLGKEPEWVKEIREINLTAKKYKNGTWTEEEHNILLSMLDANCYGYKDISTKLMRTEGAIKQYINKNKIGKKPVNNKSNAIAWTEDETNLLIDMYKKGYKPELIAEKLPNRSAMSVKGKIEKLQKKGMV